MKSSLLLLSFLVFSFTSFAQDKKEVSEEIKVWGNCGMCKSRIEKTLKGLGVTSASWSSETKMLSVKYNSEKLNNAKIQKAIAAVGHDTQDETASDEVYSKLPGCCKYERKAVATEQKSNVSATTTTAKSCCSKDASKNENAKQECKKDATANKDHKDCAKDGKSESKSCCSKKVD